MNARRLKLWGSLALGGALLVSLWAVLVWVASRPALRTVVDLTPQQVNTLDPATIELLRELRAQRAEIEFHLLYVPYQGQGGDAEQQQVMAIRSQVRELVRLLLLGYQAHGGESVTVHVPDYYRDSASYRETAQAFGYTVADDDAVVVAVRMPGKERRFRKLISLLDFAVIERPNPGVAAMSRGALPVLKSFHAEQQLSSALKSLLVEGTPVAYVMKEHSPFVQFDTASPSGYGRLFEALAVVGFEVKPWDSRTTPTVPPDATIVIVLEPSSDFSPGLADALFAFLKRGGGVFVNYVWSPVEGSNPDGGRFGELLGYSLGELPVFHMIPDRTGQTGGRALSGDRAVARLQLWANPDHPVTRRLALGGRLLEVAAARELKERPGAPTGVERHYLLQTGELGWLARPDANGYPDYTAPQVGLRRFPVAMSFEVDAGGDRTGKAVVVSGIFCNNAGMSSFGELALNICNWMAERRVLLDLKSPIHEAKFLALQPQQLERVQTFVQWGVPGFFLALGAVVFLVRRRS